MKTLLTSLLLSVTAFGQSTPEPTPQASIVFGVGVNYNKYVPGSPLWAKSLDFAAELGGTGLWSISSLTLAGTTGTLNTGLGYDFKQNGPVHVIALMQAGVTQTTPATTTGVSIGSINLGNLGGGLMVRYDLGGITKKLHGLGISASFRETAISGSNVSPELQLKLNYYIK